MLAVVTRRRYAVGRGAEKLLWPERARLMFSLALMRD